MTSLWQDVRCGLRLLTKAPGYTTIVILTLALGIGANTTIFSWINSALLNPVPGLSNPSEVLAVTIGKPGQAIAFTYPDFEAVRAEQQSFSGMAACWFAVLNFTGEDRQERVWGMTTSANYFDVLGVRPILGRTFLPSEDEKSGVAPVAIISYRLWRTYFGANPNIVGRSVELNKHSFTIVGVAPAAFQGSQTGVRTEIWIPVTTQAQLTPVAMPGRDLIHDRQNFTFLVFGRLKPGVTPESAQQELTVLLKREAKNYPEEHKGKDTVTVYPLWRSPWGMDDFLSKLLPALMAIAGLVLLLACANVANLMLVRSMGRRREIAIRMSLGASRWRLVRQLLVESLMLALAGGAMALLITFWTAGTLMKFMPKTEAPLSLPVEADRTVLLATLVIAVLTGVAFGILPALRSSGVAPVSVLKEDAGSASGGLRKARLASGLVVAQISLSLLLLICAGLFIRSVTSARRINPGFRPQNVLIASYDLSPAGYSDVTGPEFDRQFVGKLEALPGIQSVALSSRVPLAYYSDSTSVQLEGYVAQANESMETQAAVVSPNYFHTVQIPIVEGHDFTAQDTKTSQRAVIVSEAFAARYWPHQEAIGKQLKSDWTKEWFTVVGVARDTKVNDLNEKPTPFVYLPLYQVYRSEMIIHVRVAGDPLSFSKTVENTIHEMNGNLVVFDVSTVESRTQFSSFPQRVAGTFVGAFGLLALLLAAVGIYGVTAYTTRQRTHEIGIRMALGASKDDILRLVLSHGLKLMLTGVGIGLAVSFALTRFLSSLLLGVTSTDALTFSSVAIVLCCVALFACFIPARRAMGLDPLAALRYE